jgi:hypothetical protein
MWNQSHGVLAEDLRTVGVLGGVAGGRDEDVATTRDDAGRGTVAQTT